MLENIQYMINNVTRKINCTINNGCFHFQSNCLPIKIYISENKKIQPLSPSKKERLYANVCNNLKSYSRILAQTEYEET
jgi:hypothetical protein